MDSKATYKHLWQQNPSSTPYRKRPNVWNSSNNEYRQWGVWARNDKEKATAFATHLDIVFQPFSSNDPNSDEEILRFLNTPFQMELPISHITPRDVQAVIKNKIKTEEASNFDLINSRILKELQKNKTMPTYYYTNLQCSRTETWSLFMSMESCTNHNVAETRETSSWNYFLQAYVPYQCYWKCLED